jgi:ribose transport system permease protein
VTRKAYRIPRWLITALDEHGMLVVLLLVAAALSLATIQPQETTGREAGLALGQLAASQFGPDQRLLAILADSDDDRALHQGLLEALGPSGVKQLVVAQGDPSAARHLLQEPQAVSPRAIICSTTTSEWLVVRDRGTVNDKLGTVNVLVPVRGMWPRFLTRVNILNIANQISVISIIAIGMTLVVVTGGIDLSVGSLVALSGVLAADFIRAYGGGVEARASTMVFGCLLGIAAATLAGCFSGLVIVGFGVPPFLSTLATMLIVRGAALQWTGGESIAALPDRFVWLGRGTEFGIPVAVWLAVLLFVAFHLVLTRTVLGRHWLAIGGNPIVARLAGIRVGAAVVLTYAISGLLAGLGGVVLTSQLKNASPTYGDGYELTVIAAVVVGGASLNGGRARMAGTLTGALLIATIQNGMNLLDISPFVQKIVLGMVILISVLLDRWRQHVVLCATG